MPKILVVLLCVFSGGLWSGVANAAMSDNEKAALAPAQSPYLYYVVIDKKGDTAFATTLQQQDANIALAKKNGAPVKLHVQRGQTLGVVDL